MKQPTAEIRYIWERDYRRIAIWRAAFIVVASEALIAPLALTAAQELGLMWVARLIGILHRVH